MRTWRFAGETYQCPVVLTIDRLRGRWKTNILWFIWTGTNRFNGICAALPQVQRGVIARQLRSLERDGLLYRTVICEKPLHIEYQLSELGESLAPLVASLAAWGEEHGTPQSLDTPSA
ncbi:MAG: transcriptional regulator [Spirochaetaceae bacterium]|nr:MAG: transcriptional regulator [Spirochaetaceae bacterium]